MVSVEISPPANDDLEDIFQYSQQKWGVEQARSYTAELLAVIRHLETFPEIGRAIGRQTLRRLVHQKHVILYRYDSNQVTVLRIASVRDAKVLEAGEEDVW